MNRVVAEQNAREYRYDNEKNDDAESSSSQRQVWLRHIIEVPSG